MRRALTVLSVAYALAPVGTDATGGAEQVLSALDEGLVRRGHHSVVVAHDGSSCAGTLVSTPRPRAPFDDRSRAEAAAHHRRVLDYAITAYSPDIVHYHGLDFPEYAGHRAVAEVATLHLPPWWYAREVLASPSPLQRVFVSRAQRSSVGRADEVGPVIRNGIDLRSFPVGQESRRHTLVLGRICPEKGFHLAVAASRRAGVPIVVAGAVFPYDAHQRYFEQVLRPSLAGAGEFVGAVGRAEKAQLLRSARCLLVPSLVAETSSLVAMEALASGTPVVAFRAGALVDIVEHGRTGFLVGGVEEMADAIARASSLDPAACRAAAERRFDVDRTIDEYIALYSRLA